VRSVFNDPRFRVFIPAIATVWFGLSMVQLSLALIITVLMGLPQSAVTLFLGLTVGTTVVSLPFTARLIRRRGGRRTILGAMTLLAVELPLAAAIGRWPVPLSPAVEGAIILLLAGPAIGAMFILPNALLAEIAEDHGRRGGMRVEGMFFAFQGLIFNGTTSLSAAVLGGLLQWLGQAPPDALGLRAALLAAAVSTAAGALIFTRYPQSNRAPSRRRL
jgi:GPH family glycoside/pentoside/hexuronide:cation symporter